MHLHTYMIFRDLKLSVFLFLGSDLSEIVYNASKLPNFIAARLINKMFSENHLDPFLMVVVAASLGPFYPSWIF